MERRSFFGVVAGFIVGLVCPWKKPLNDRNDGWIAIAHQSPIGELLSTKTWLREELFESLTPQELRQMGFEYRNAGRRWVCQVDRVPVPILIDWDDDDKPV